MRLTQQVCFVLALQAVIFYAPRGLWGVWERNTVTFLSKDLTAPIPDESWMEKKKPQLIGFFANAKLRSHNFYAIRFLLCEIMNLVISVNVYIN